MMTDLPTGMLTYLFTDIEGSTRLWEQYPEAMRPALACHDLLLRRAVEANQGAVVKTTGDGMLAAFRTVKPAMLAALSAQQALQAESWTEIQPHKIKVRMAIHAGAAEQRDGDYYGTVLNRAARLMAAGHGGQVLVSEVAAGLARDDLPEHATLLDLGEHRLKDLSRPEHIYQLTRPGLGIEFPPLATLDSIPNNLPQQLTSFVGREKELEMTRERLQSARLLTMIGPGGTGKTRLALQLAAETLTGYPDGVWLVELAPLADPALVVQTVAAALNLREVPGLSLEELLTNHLRARRLLLVLDNCEHLIEACASLADHLLRLCQHLQIVASSREALGIPGEVIYRVPPLALPDEKETSTDRLCHFEAVQLFVERAQAVQPSFTFSEANAPAVAQISRRLDGIPLALELAAARVRSMPPGQIAAHLNDRFRLLTGGNRTALPRQQTLRSLIDWSYDLLSPDEQTLFRRLAVFAGGWTLEAAEAISPDLDVLSLMDTLVNKSLVTQEDQDGTARFYLLETIRQYARDRLLETAENPLIRDRHFWYFYQLIVTPSIVTPFPSYRPGSHSIVWYKTCDLENDNLRLALSWGLESDPEADLRLAATLSDFWSRRTYFADSQSWLTAALERVDKLPEVQGEANRERQVTRARALLGLSQPALFNFSTRIETSRKSVDLFREYGSREDLCFALGMLGFNLELAGDYQQAVQVLQEAIAMGRDTNDLPTIGMALGVYSMVLLGSHGNLDEARRFAEEAVTLGRQHRDQMPWGSAISVMTLAQFDVYTGQFEQARSYTQEALEIFTSLEDPLMINNARSLLGHIELAQGNFQAARQIYRQTLPRYLEINNSGAVAHQLECMAITFTSEGQLQHAARLLGAAEALRERIHTPMALYEVETYNREVATLHIQMSAKDLQAAWAEGRQLTREQAVELAMENQTSN